MEVVTGKLKPRQADSTFGFLVPEDGSADVYLKFSDLTDKHFSELYGCILTVEIEVGEKGRVATSIMEIHGDPIEIPTTSARQSKASPTRAVQPGQYLSRWANINLIDHVQIIHQPDGTTTDKLHKSSLPELHSMLLSGEEWDFQAERALSKFKILENYLRFTFFRIFHEEKIAFSSDKSIALFDTGLVDNLFEPIYAVFFANKPESKRPYRFDGWCSAGRGALGKRILAPFPRMPDRAQFFSNINDVILPRDIEVVEQWEHIIDDGVRRGRYPGKFLKRYVPDSFNFDVDLADGKFVSTQERLKYLDDTMDCISDSRDYLEFKHKIESCIKTALKRVEWNYKTAIPIYHPRRDRMSIALPLALFDSETADLALILEKKNIRTYYASTVLTLDQAYLSARLVCRPLSDWLTTNIGVSEFGMDEQ